MISATYVMPVIGPRLGIAHPLPTGAQHLIDGITDPTLRSGTFYASAANTITGPVSDQAKIFGDLANPTYQDNANQAIHPFTGVGGPFREHPDPRLPLAPAKAEQWPGSAKGSEW